MKNALWLKETIFAVLTIKMNLAFLLLGSNEGNRMHWLQYAIQLIHEKIGLVVNCSSVYETAAWGLEDQNSFYNLVLAIETEQNAFQLLQSIQFIEQECGRQRNLKWGARTLDIDILYFNDEIIKTENLKVPHPFINKRKFTLVPLFEIAPSMIHPVFLISNEQLLLDCNDSLPVLKIISHLKTRF